MANLTTFKSDIFGSIRTTQDDASNPLFCLADICKVLGLQPNKVKQRLDNEGAEFNSVPTENQHGAEVMQQMTFVNEPNLYRCIFQSRKKEAIDFQRWIFNEVLPSIRRNGGYIAGQVGTSSADFERAVQERAQCIVDAKQKELVFWRGVAQGQQTKINELTSEIETLCHELDVTTNDMVLFRNYWDEHHPELQ